MEAVAKQLQEKTEQQVKGSEAQIKEYVRRGVLD